MSRLASLFAQVCVATVLAQAAILGFLYGTGRLDRSRLARLMAVFHGLDLAAVAPPPAAAAPGQPPTTETSFAARSRQLQQLAQREQALDQQMALLQRQQTKLAAEMQKLDAARKTFEKQLQDWETGQQRQALENTVALLGGMKPKQAKEQLVLMLQKDELDWVVRLIEQLPASQRSKIVAEFKTADENQQLANVIRRIRDAALQAALAEEARQALAAPAP